MIFGLAVFYNCKTIVEIVEKSVEIVENIVEKLRYIIISLYDIKMILKNRNDTKPNH